MDTTYLYNNMSDTLKHIDSEETIISIIEEDFSDTNSESELINHVPADIDASHFLADIRPQQNENVNENANACYGYFVVMVGLISLIIMIIFTIIIIFS